MRVTKYIITTPESNILPSDIAMKIYGSKSDVNVKETCFGVMVNGEEDVINALVREIRSMDPSGIFIKDRGFPPGDARRCRANLGGARPGYNGLEFEMSILPYVSHGLEVLDKKDAQDIPPPEDPLEHPQLDIYKLKKLIDAQES
jgi:putative methanogenesis marker protein 6